MNEAESHIQELYSQYNAYLKQKRNIGLRLILVAVICIIAAVVANSISDILGIAIMSIAFIIFMIGLIIAAYYFMSRKSIKAGIGIISLIKEPTLDPEHGLVYAIVDDIYLIVTHRSDMLCVISFRKTPSHSDKESLKIPLSVLEWGKKTKVGNTMLFRKEGVYRVPSPDGGFVEGEAVAYATPVITRSIISDSLTGVPEYTREQLLEILETIKQETKAR